MIPVHELNFGFRDAENYKKRKNKDLFNSLFFHTRDLDKLSENDVYFLIGEKGTGKTAYAVYLSNNETKENSALIRYVREPDYRKFIKLRKDHNLDLSDYDSIWSIIIYLLLAQHIMDKEIDILKCSKFKALKNVIDDFYSNIFTPEINQAIRFVEHSKSSARLVSSCFASAEVSSSGGEFDIRKSTEIASGKSLFQMNLYYIQKQFEDVLRAPNLSRNYTLFIDGIDVRPYNISYDDYLECVQGLAHSAWSINNDIFSSIKDSKGRLRVVLLLRPDIYEAVNLQNKNNKLRDNSVLLDWRTSYTDYRTSPIFSVADNILKSQQPSEVKTSMYTGDAWDYYFPYDSEDFKKHYMKNTAFVDFLKYSLSRPRDIVTMLKCMQEVFIRKDKKPDQVFSSDDFYYQYFLDQLSNYYLGEIKDELMFYYTETNYNVFLMFFEHLKGNTTFSYYQYKDFFNSYIHFITNNNYEVPPFCNNEDTFLQFLYDHNIICYSEPSPISLRRKNIWCFKERTYGNISPRVRTHNYYTIHDGLVNFVNSFVNG